MTSTAKIKLLVAVIASAFLLTGCFSTIPVKQYSVDQQKPSKPATSKSNKKRSKKARKGASKAQASPSSVSTAVESHRLDELEKLNRILDIKVDLIERRLAEIEEKVGKRR